MNTNLTGKVILITGASGGIGSAMARAFAGEGAKLVLHYHRNLAGARKLQRELAAAEPFLVRADLTKESQVRDLFAQVLKQFRRVDTFVANAGSWETREVPLHRVTVKQWRGTLDGVLTSTFLCLREFFRLVAKQKRGNAVLIGSTAAVFGEANHADYAAAKAAMAFGLTRSLKNELSRLAPHTRDYCGGRINCVCPGWTVVHAARRSSPTPKPSAKSLRRWRCPRLRGLTTLANAVVYLSSDTLARHVTGQTLVVAGGWRGVALATGRD